MRKTIEIQPELDGNWEFIDIVVFLYSVLSDWTKENQTSRIYKRASVTKLIVILYTSSDPKDLQNKVHIHVETETKKRDKC